MTKILVIEDEQPLLEEILEMLNFEGFQTSGAPDGLVGLEMAQTYQPDLIISDIAMPEMDGYGVLDHLRQNPTTAATPLIFLTARAEKTFMRHGMELGADDYVTKPFTNGELLGAIRARLERHSVINEVSQAQVEGVKQQLAQVIAHELRTPLVSIFFVQDMLSDYFDTLSPEDITEMLASLTYGTQRMGHVVEQMVLYTSLESNLLTPEVVQEHGIPVRLSSLIASAASLAPKFVYRQNDANLLIDMPNGDLKIQADKSALKHALAEVISNALKFSPKGGDVTVSQQYDEDWVIVRVTDQGSGIPKDRLEEALDAFTQIGRAVTEQQGTGLGLALAKRIIEVHGGTLALISDIGQGTCAEIALPLLQE